MDVVRTAPWLVHLGIGAEHVVVHEHVLEPELLDPQPIGAHPVDGGADLGLRKHDSDLHIVFTLIAPKHYSYDISWGTPAEGPATGTPPTG